MSRMIGSRRLVGLCVVVLPVLASAGCRSLFDSSLLSHHLAENRRSSAQDQWNDVRAKVKLQIAEQHFAAGRLKEAAITLQQVLAMSPQNVKASNLAGRLYLEQGQLVMAAEVIESAVAQSDHDAETEYLAGIIDERYGRSSEAYEHYSTAAAMSPNTASYVRAAAEVLLDLGKPTKALALIEPRLKDFDGSAAMRMLAARICRSLGRKQPAMTYCREAMQLETNDKTTDMEAGLILIWAEQYAEAIDLLRPIVDQAFRPGSPGRYSDLGSRFRRQKHDPNLTVTPGVIHALANAYLATHRWAEAQDMLKAVMAVDTTDITTCCLYARAALRAGDFTAAAQAISTFHQQNAPTAETLLLQAHIAYLQGDYSAAQDAARRALKLDRRIEPALWLIGLSAQSTGRMDQARHAYDRALAMNPDSPVAQALLNDLNQAVSIRSMLHVLESNQTLNGQGTNDRTVSTPSPQPQRTAKIPEEVEP